MAPQSIQDAVQSGLDVEPNNTFLQATDITLTSDAMMWSGALDVDDIDVWHIKAKSGTIADIRVISDENVDVVADFAPIANDSERRYYDVAKAGNTEVLPNIRLTPQGGFLTVRARNDEKTGAVNYRIEIQRLSVENGVLESEPNEIRDMAVSIPGTGLVSGTLYPSGDVDIFRTQIQAPTTVSFSLPESPVEVSIEQRDKVVWSIVSKNAQEITSDMISADDQNVYIRVKGLGEIRDVQAYRFELKPMSEIPDEIEPNNTIDRAQVVQEEVQKLEFSLSDDSDVDIFRFGASKDRVYRVRLGGVASGQATVGMVNANGQIRTDVLSDGQIVCDAVVPEGQNDVYIRVTSAKGTTEYPQKYRLIIESEEAAAAEHEPNQTLEQATELALNQTLKGHVFPSGDVDVYRIVVPPVEGIPTGPAGVLSIDTEGGYIAALQLKMQDKDGFEISQVRNTQYSRPIHMSVDVPSGTYYLTVSGGGDNCAKSYALKASFVANEPEAEKPAEIQGDSANAQPPADAAAQPAAAIDADLDALIRAAQADGDKPQENPVAEEAKPEEAPEPAVQVDEDAF